MPYITQEDRAKVLGGKTPETVGELVFVLSTVINEYLVARTPLRFTDMAEVLGALESARIAFDHDVLQPYEKDKKRQNGAVFTCTAASP